jgi:hypothetical protein
MDKISVQLFQKPVTSVTPDLNVNSISNLNLIEIPTMINRLITTKQQIRQKKIEVYKKYFYLCLQHIEVANKIGKTDIFFKVPHAIYDNLHYNLNECIEYITKMLKEYLFNWVLMNDTTIFISWHFLELHLEHRT